MIKPEDRRNGLGVADRAFQDHLENRPEGQHAFEDDFVFLWFGFALTESGGEVDRHRFCNESWTGVELQNTAPVGGAVPGFFDELALGSFEFVLSWIDAARGQLPKIILCGVTVLAFEKDASRGAGVIDCQHDNRTGVMDDIAANRYAARFFDVVGAYPKHGAAIYRAGRDQAGFGLGVSGLRRGRFGHGNNIKQVSAAGMGWGKLRRRASPSTLRLLRAGPTSGAVARWFVSWVCAQGTYAGSWTTQQKKWVTGFIDGGRASAMLPGMKRKPRIAIVGPGNLGRALAVSLCQAGYRIEAILGGSRGSAQNLAKRVGSSGSDASRADLVWFCVPDAEIARAAVDLVERYSWKGKVALHSSGALSSDELDVLGRVGASVGSAHPMMTFVRGARPSLKGVPFAIEGDESAVRVAQAIVRDLGGEAYTIRKKEKAAYHAWGTFASPLLTALFATTEQVAGLAGLKRKTARRRMKAILFQTLSNYAALGAAAGFSGPIVRGDVQTIRKHLEILRATPQARTVYVALARAALEYLPAKNKGAIKRLLASGE